MNMYSTDNIVKDAAVYTPFIYVDVSDASTLTLYIQPLPERFNVSSYKVWMMNNETNSTKEIILERPEGNQLIHHNFTVDNGVLYFKVAALHRSCHQYGCINSTSPFISISKYKKTFFFPVSNYTFHVYIIFAITAFNSFFYRASFAPITYYDN